MFSYLPIKKVVRNVRLLQQEGDRVQHEHRADTLRRIRHLQHRRPADSNHSAGAIHPQTRSRAWFGNSQIGLEIFWLLQQRGRRAVQEERRTDLPADDDRPEGVPNKTSGRRLHTTIATGCPRQPASSGRRWRAGSSRGGCIRSLLCCCCRVAFRCQGAMSAEHRADCGGGRPF